MKLLISSSLNRPSLKSESGSWGDNWTEAWLTFSKEMHPKIKAYIEGLKDRGAQDVATLKAFKKQVAKVAVLMYELYDRPVAGKAIDKALEAISTRISSWPKLPKGKAFKDTKEGKIARAIHEAAVKRALSVLRDCYSANYGINIDMGYLFGLSCAVDHLIVASYMNQDNFKAADTYHGTLDTVSRDEIPIPNSFYVYRDKKYKEKTN